MKHHRLNHMLEQCLGEDGIEPDRGEFTWKPGDMLLMCSDGLYNMVDDEQIRQILTECQDLYQQADLLLEPALETGGKDNVSFILGHNGQNLQATVTP